MTDKKTDKAVKAIEKLIEGNDPIDILSGITPFLKSVSIEVTFLEEEGMVVGTVIEICKGDYKIRSEPSILDWPLQRLPIPGALKGALN